MSERKVEIPTAITCNALFRTIPPVELAGLVVNATHLNLRRGDCLYRPGERPAGSYSVLSGHIMLRIGTPPRPTKVIALAGPGEHIGLARALLDETVRTTAEAVADSTVLLLSRELLIACASKHPEFSMQLMLALSREVCARVADIEAFALHSVRERVAHYLLEIAAAHGRTSITLPAKKSVIASRLSLTPETFSRTLRELIEASLIAVDGRHITIIDGPALRGSRPPVDAASNSA